MKVVVGLAGEVPPGPVTLTSTMPVSPGGAVAVISVLLSTMNSRAAAAPKETPLALVKSVPVIVTTVPPTVGPDAGDRPLIAGAGGT